MAKIYFNLPPLTVDKQLELLREKGLEIADTESAKHWLSHISYFRFKHYSQTYKDYDAGNGNYIDGITFDTVKELYSFDRKIKLLIFEALENIEVAIKTLLTNHMATAYGPHWYLDETRFISDHERKQIMRKARTEAEIPKYFDHAVFLRNIEEMMRDPDEPYLQQYKKMFDPLHPPAWMLSEVITFGTLSILYENLAPCAEKTAMHDHFGLTKKHFTSWLHCFNFIRNRCAHHSRLVYAKINFAPSLPMRASRQFLAEADAVENATLYAVLCCIQYTLNVCNHTSQFKQQLLKLIDTYPSIDHKQLGFTPNWRAETLWS